VKKIQQEEKTAAEDGEPKAIEKKIEAEKKKVEAVNKVNKKEKKPEIKINPFDGLYHYDDKVKGKRGFPDGGAVGSVNNRL